MPIATDLLYAWSQGIYPPSTDTSYNNPALAGLNSYELFNFMLENFKESVSKLYLMCTARKLTTRGITILFGTIPL